VVFFIVTPREAKEERGRRLGGLFLFRLWKFDFGIFSFFRFKFQTAKRDGPGFGSGSGAPVFLPFPGQAGGAERRKTHRENMHRARPDGLTSPGSLAACVSGIVAKDADNAHARRRSTGGDFLPRSRTSGDWTGFHLIRRLSPPSSVPRPAIEGSPS